VALSGPPPVPTGAVGGYPMPSLQDERDTYASWGWSWSPSVEPGAVTEPLPGYTVNASDVDVRYDTEGDDLWTYLMMYRRTGNTVYLNRAQAWLRYFKQDYLAALLADDAFAHMYGWGLLAWYEHSCEQGSCDVDALTAAESFGAAVEGRWASAVPGQETVAYWGPRRAARHLLLATRLADVTGDQRWINLRDKLIDLWLQSPDWDPRGMYFIGDADTDEVVGTGAYAAGARVESAFQIGIISEAFDHAYRSSGRTELRNRMVAMARFVDQYGMDPTYQYTGAYFGIVNGKMWHDFSASCGSACTSADPSYSTSLVNTLVRGYKYTGDVALLNRAKHFFNRGTKGVYGSLARSAPDNGVHHFVDTVFSSGNGYFYLAYNKGELQYTYLIFENGGTPNLE
jgi:hypothetical protein